MMTPEQVMEMLDKHCNVLSEHCDSVQILASWLNPDGTTSSVSRGSGNWFARRGMASDFISRSQADDIGKSVAENISGET